MRTVTSMLADKESIRNIMREKRRRMPAEEVKEKSAVIVKRLVELPEFEKAKRIMFYSGVKKEVQTKDAIGDAIKQGKSILLPITDIAEKKNSGMLL